MTSNENNCLLLPLYINHKDFFITPTVICEADILFSATCTKMVDKTSHPRVPISTYESLISREKLMEKSFKKKNGIISQKQEILNG